MVNAVTGMDDATAAHLAVWSEAHLRDEERAEALDAILTFVHEYPDVVARRGWRETLDLARRYRDGL